MRSVRATRQVLPFLFFVACAAEARASSPPAPSSPVSLERYEQVLRSAGKLRPGAAPPVVKFRFEHLVDDVPDVVYTELRKVAGEWVAVKSIWGHEEQIRAGDDVGGVKIRAITRGQVLCEYRNKLWSAVAKPAAPSIVCLGTENRGGHWIADLEVGKLRELYRKGDDIQGAQVEEIDASGVQCSYHGVRASFTTREAFPGIPCHVTQPTPGGWIVHLMLPDGLRAFNPGDAHRGARVAEIRKDGAVFEFLGEKRFFPTPPIPELAYTGFSEKRQGPRVGFIEIGRESLSVQVGQTVSVDHQEITIAEISDRALHFWFRGIRITVSRRQ